MRHQWCSLSKREQNEMHVTHIQHVGNRELTTRTPDQSHVTHFTRIILPTVVKMKFLSILQVKDIYRRSQISCQPTESAFVGVHVSPSPYKDRRKHVWISRPLLSTNLQFPSLIFLYRRVCSCSIWERARTHVWQVSYHFRLVIKNILLIAELYTAWVKGSFCKCSHITPIQ